MSLTKEQMRFASKIDNWVKGIEKRGGGEKEMLEGMYDYMATFKSIIDSSNRDQMDELTVKYPGFYRFAKLLEDLARGIQNGSIKVPK